jgi:hypothetical protein
MRFQGGKQTVVGVVGLVRRICTNQERGRALYIMNINHFAIKCTYNTYMVLRNEAKLFGSLKTEQELDLDLDSVSFVAVQPVQISCRM